MKESSFQMIGQKLLTSIFKVNPEYNNDAQIKLEFKTDIKIEKNENEEKAVVILTLEIFDEKYLKKYPFYIKSEIKGFFSWNKELKDIDTYLKVNAPAVLLSYLRSIIVQLTVFAGYPPLNLPLINFSLKK